MKLMDENQEEDIEKGVDIDSMSASA